MGKEKDPLEWEEVSCENIVNDEWIQFRRQAFRLPDGTVFEPFYTYSRRDYVVVVATDEDGNYICVRQFRQGIRRVTTEFVAGGIERSDGKQYGTVRDAGGDGAKAAEDSLEAAKRELREETGYESDDWKYILTIPSNATIADNMAHIFVAKRCRKVSGQSLDETEFLNVSTHSGDELEAMVRSGEFPQSMHVLAWLLSQRS